MFSTNSNLNLKSIPIQNQPPPFGVDSNWFLHLLFINILFNKIPRYFSLCFSLIFLLKFYQLKSHHVATFFSLPMLSIQYFTQFFHPFNPYVFLKLFSPIFYFSFHFLPLHYYLILYAIYNGIWTIQLMHLDTDRTCLYCTGWIVARIFLHSIYSLFPYVLSTVCMNYLNANLNND